MVNNAGASIFAYPSVAVKWSEEGVGNAIDGLSRLFLYASETWNSASWDADTETSPELLPDVCCVVASNFDTEGNFFRLVVHNSDIEIWKNDEKISTKSFYSLVQSLRDDTPDVPSFYDYNSPHASGCLTARMIIVCLTACTGFITDADSWDLKIELECRKWEEFGDEPWGDAPLGTGENWEHHIKTRSYYFNSSGEQILVLENYINKFVTLPWTLAIYGAGTPTEDNFYEKYRRNESADDYWTYNKTAENWNAYDLLRPPWQFKDNYLTIQPELATIRFSQPNGYYYTASLSYIADSFLGYKMDAIPEACNFFEEGYSHASFGVGRVMRGYYSEYSPDERVELQSGVGGEVYGAMQLCTFYTPSGEKIFSGYFMWNSDILLERVEDKYFLRVSIKNNFYGIHNNFSPAHWAGFYDADLTYYTFVDSLSKYEKITDGTVKDFGIVAHPYDFFTTIVPWYGMADSGDIEYPSKFFCGLFCLQDNKWTTIFGERVDNQRIVSMSDAKNWHNKIELKGAFS